ncbi:hypothetical protein GALMADRAFT_1127040 [Galerina marginata CBS 339.88]|uniref:Uncharacterized protein n=1 Tax=Galerina marginata (strain CBS 339.88) TaxID=685588 RepID=A0A067S8R8_GALM3|nr:hypothetical protein GALMADRAFT_1127040 [Galerina marginata CBS 339.88]
MSSLRSLLYDFLHFVCIIHISVLILLHFPKRRCQSGITLPLFCAYAATPLRHLRFIWPFGCSQCFEAGRTLPPRNSERYSGNVSFNSFRMHAPRHM